MRTLKIAVVAAGILAAAIPAVAAPLALSAGGNVRTVEASDCKPSFAVGGVEVQGCTSVGSIDNRDWCELATPPQDGSPAWAYCLNFGNTEPVVPTKTSERRIVKRQATAFTGIFGSAIRPSPSPSPARPRGNFRPSASSRAADTNAAQREARRVRARIARFEAARDAEEEERARQEAEEENDDQNDDNDNDNGNDNRNDEDEDEDENDNDGEDDDDENEDNDGDDQNDAADNNGQDDNENDGQADESPTATSTSSSASPTATAPATDVPVGTDFRTTVVPTGTVVPTASAAVPDSTSSPVAPTDPPIATDGEAAGAGEERTGLAPLAIGGIVAGVLFLFALIACLLCGKRRKQQKQVGDEAQKQQQQQREQFSTGKPAGQPTYPVLMAPAMLAGAAAVNEKNRDNRASMSSYASSARSFSGPSEAASSRRSSRTSSQYGPNPAEIAFDRAPLGRWAVGTSYFPSLSDELEIEAGDIVDVYEEFDDGWVTGVNVSRGFTKGVLPRHCLDFDDGQPSPVFDAMSSG